MVKCLPEFKYFTVRLKNIKFISKIRRSKVIDYAALNKAIDMIKIVMHFLNYTTDTQN